MTAVEFFVPGIAKTAGSKRGFAVKKGGKYTGKVIITDDAGQKGEDWRGDVKTFATKHFAEPFTGPIRLTIRFVMKRIRAHYFTGKRSDVLRPSAPTLHVKKPDATKLLRSVEDALTGIAWVDDTQVCMQSVFKVYGLVPGAHITIEELECI